MMSKNVNAFAVRVSVLAVQGALISMMAMPAHAEDASVTELTRPTNKLEVGVIGTDKSSYKFGEYNGLSSKDPAFIGNFELFGGGGDESVGGDDVSALRYRITGTDLGLDTRNLSVEYGVQGVYRITFAYDELTRRISDSFMSPYSGAGSNRLTLPANWATNNRTGCAVNATASGNTVFGGSGVPGSPGGPTAGTAGCGNYYISQSAATPAVPTATPTGNAAALTAAELADFQHVNLQTKRTKGDLGFSYIISPQWDISASIRHELKEGVQAIGSAAAGTTNAQVTVLNPISYQTTDFNLKLAHTAEKGFIQAAYFGSIFEDKINGFTYQNPYFSSAVPSVTSAGVATFPFADNIRMGTAPSNQFHQLNLSGGYNFNKTTKLVVDASYGRSTQNDSYLPYGTGLLETRALPQSSLNGVVLTKAVSMKLTARPISELRLAAGYKYDERDNHTASNTYVSPYNPQESQISPLAGTSTIFNMPYSKRLQQINLDADWSFMKGQAVKAGFEFQDITRWCSGLPASAVSIPSCVNSVHSEENTWRVDYRNTMLESVIGKIGYAVSDRSASDYNGNPAQYVSTQYKTDILTRFNMTDRKRDKLRSSLTWQATDAFDLTVGYDFNNDDYKLGNKTSAISMYGYGLDTAKSTVLNLDASYRFTDAVSMNVFYSEEDIKSVLKGNAANVSGNPASGNWQVTAKDKVKTYGLSVRAKDIVAGKISLAGDYVKSDASSPYALAEGSVFAITGNTTLTSAQNVSAAGSAFYFPDTYSNSDTLKLNATYKVSKSSSVRLSYLYQKLSSADPTKNNGLQQGAANNASNGSATAKVNGAAVSTANLVPVSSLIPTNEQSPNYRAQAVGLSYIYSFQ